MKFVKSDIVRLKPNEAFDQIKQAIEERFPVAYDMLIGKFDISDTHLLYELRQLFQFMSSNWQEASKDSIFHQGEWRDIFDSLRYAAEEIGYLPKNKRMDSLRESAKKLSAKILENDLTKGCKIRDLGSIQYEDLPIYPGDWLTMLQCMHYVATQVPDDDPDVYMRNLKKRVERISGVVANRVVHHEQSYWAKCGMIDEISIKRRLEDIRLMPWEKQAELYKDGKKAVEGEYGEPVIVELPLNKFQGPDPKEVAESTKEYEGADPEYVKDMEGIPGVDYTLLSHWELMEKIKRNADEEEE